MGQVFLAHFFSWPPPDRAEPYTNYIGAEIHAATRNEANRREFPMLVRSKGVTS